MGFHQSFDLVIGLRVVELIRALYTHRSMSTRCPEILTDHQVEDDVLDHDERYFPSSSFLLYIPHKESGPAVGARQSADKRVERKRKRKRNAIEGIRRVLFIFLAAPFVLFVFHLYSIMYQEAAAKRIIVSLL